MIGIIVQARVGSTRLPGKVLKLLCGKTLLGHLIDRLKRVERADRLIVAIPKDHTNDELALYCEREEVDCFRGSEDDVLGRYYQCARKFQLTHIVRATADCPLIDPVEVDALIELHLERQADYSSNKDEVGCRLPNGTGLEMFTYQALERAHNEGHEPHHREHINEYVVEHPEIFRIAAYDEPLEKRAPDLDFTVDTPDDFTFVKEIIAHFQGDHDRLTTEAIIAYCRSRNPEP